MGQLTDFLNHIKKNNIARSNRFRVTFSLPSTIQDANAQKVISLTCLMADVPGYHEHTSDVAYGNLPRKVVFGKTQGDFTTTFLMTGNYEEKKLFDKWHATIMNEENTSFEYYDNYVSQVTVDCLNTQDQTTYSFVLTEVYPLNVGPLKLDRNGQNQQMVLDVTWAYHRVKTDEENAINISSNIPGNFAPMGGANIQSRLAPIPGLASFSSGVQSAMQTVSGFRNQLQGALNVAKDVREQVRDFKMQVVDGVKMMNGVIKDVRAIRNIPIDVKNEITSVFVDTRNQLGYLKDDTKLIASPFPKR